ncbi:MAG: Gfo/Idh/MocA family oxidoreductase [Verrucomicrobiota bacterium]|jgi:predicted dehydrogenase
MNTPLLRWGILGAANIARKNWKAIWNSKNGVVTAVASRDAKRSQRFINECQAQAAFNPAPRALGSYEELLASKEVDAVYVPLPTGIRAAWVKRAAEAGKHVVCEKPCATSLAELTEMLETCRRHRVQFMDGVMFMHSRRLERIREMLDNDRSVGRIRRITSVFTFRASEAFFDSNIRARSELEPHGCLGDLGWYCIRFALWVMNWKPPERVTGQALREFKHPGSGLPVPTEFSGELFFEGGVSSSFYCSFLSATEQWAIVSGERGHLRVPDFVQPFAGNQLAFETGSPVLKVQGCDFEMQPHTRRWEVKERSHSDTTAQESRLFRHFAEQVQTGKLDPLWPKMALQTQLVMQACRESSLAQGRPVLHFAQR